MTFPSAVPVGSAAEADPLPEMAEIASTESPASSEPVKRLSPEASEKRWFANAFTRASPPVTAVAPAVPKV
ncbi:MAG: hypothetical protein AB7O66_20260, partial [Limisphaerales bacterium]